MISEFWLVREFGTLLKAANIANVQSFQSHRASMNLAESDDHLASAACSVDRMQLTYWSFFHVYCWGEVT